MIVKTCLLVSDDPDDQIEFTEALQGISDNIIVLSLPDPFRAADLVLSKRHIPDYMIVDMALNGFSHDFFSRLEADDDFAKIFVLVYGDNADYEKLSSPRVSAFLGSDTGYADMRSMLRKYIAG